VPEITVMTAMSDGERGTSAADLELAKFRLERIRHWTDVAKWIVVAIGAIISFLVIDNGKLKLERFRVNADSQRQLLEAYLKATEAPEPEVWKRKLHVLERFADDDRIHEWAEEELKYIESFAALNALYRETLKVASQLIDPSQLKDTERTKARVRFDQLYWADLPYSGESQAVISAMIAFRESLMTAERAPGNSGAWEALNVRLIELSQALRGSTPPQPARPRLPKP
jgi:hypothetical protein